MKILVMGGTRFVGKSLVHKLISLGHDLTLFTRGNKSIPENAEHLQGDRTKSEDLRLLQGRTFDVIVDSSGRRKEDTENVLGVTGSPRYRFIYVSSAGVYKDSALWPLDEESPIDPNSRHIGKALTEEFLKERHIPFTSFRPTYIYGPGNYNPIESWFFDRIVNNRPIPIPGDGSFITQLGHVWDLSEAIIKSLNCEISTNKIYNCSGLRGVTLKGFAESAAIVCGKAPSEINMIPFDYSKLELKDRKAFPVRIGHFFTNTLKLQKEVGWKPSFDLIDGLRDSYNNDYIQNISEPDFTGDMKLIGS